MRTQVLEQKPRYNDEAITLTLAPFTHPRYRARAYMWLDLVSPATGKSNGTIQSIPYYLGTIGGRLTVPKQHRSFGTLCHDDLLQKTVHNCPTSTALLQFWTPYYPSLRTNPVAKKEKILALSLCLPLGPDGYTRVQQQGPNPISRCSTRTKTSIYKPTPSHSFVTLPFDFCLDLMLAASLG
jgi:hypothetical protein